MPKYTYICDICQSLSTIIHSMGDKEVVCKSCGGPIRRVYDEEFTITKDRSKEPGKVVNSFIKEAKEDLKEQMEELKGKEFKK